MIKLFISHANGDAALAKAVTVLFQQALRLQDVEIRCTSVTPYNLPAGANTDSTLRKEIKQAKLVVGILTEDSAESYYVLAEMGARWAIDKPFMILRSSNFTFSGFSGPLANLMISPIDSKAIWIKHLKQAAKYFGRGRINETDVIKGYIAEAIKQNKLLSTGILQIHSAIWGTATANVDITSRIGSIVANDSLSAYVGNDLAARDPAGGLPKELQVDYTYNGKRQTKKWNEGVHLQIP
jgi:hypothetical protein